MMNSAWVAKLLLAGAAVGPVLANPVFLAEAFGLKADGKTDDGPAIQRMLEAARAADGPATLRFPKDRQIRVASGTERYAFRLDRMEDLVIDGGGSVFLVDKELRFLHATSCTNLGLVNANVDMVPSPTVEATVLSYGDGGRTLNVRLDEPARSGELGGPTKQDGEQDFFGMLWLPGKHAVESHHYYVEGVSSTRAGGVVEVRGTEPLPKAVANAIEPGKTRISLPVAGIAHRYGPSALVRIDRCMNVALRDVEIWSAPWFAFQVFRNDGRLEFRRVHIRPKPGSGRTTSSWRDGFHVKGNRGSLLFEECVLEGMNDDAFNVSAHAWEIDAVLAPDRIRIKQVFPIQAIPPQVGGELLVLSPDGTRRLAPARIVAIDGLSGDETIYLPGHRKAPVLELALDRSLQGLEPGGVLWDLSVANPDTTIRKCRIGNSCRFQSPVLLEDCEVSAFVWFYSAGVEGPLPSGSVVRGCVFRQGRGNDRYAVAANGWRTLQAPAVLPPAEAFPFNGIRFENNGFFGGLLIDGVNGVALENNRVAAGEIKVENSIRAAD